MRIWSTGRHTPSANSQEYPLPPPPGGETHFNPTETFQYQNMFLERKFVEKDGRISKVP